MTIIDAVNWPVAVETSNTRPLGGRATAHGMVNAGNELGGALVDNSGSS